MTQVSFKLDKGIAFVMMHSDGSRTLHVFTESGTLKVPDDCVSLYQVAEPAPTVFGQGASVFATGGGGAGGRGLWSRPLRRPGTGGHMKPVAIDTDDFLRAQVVGSTRQSPDGSGHNARAMWWRRYGATFGTTWTLHFLDAKASGPAVVDDFGNLVLAGARP